LAEKEEFLKNEKLRIGKLYSTKHRKGFSNKDEFVKWFENTINLKISNAIIAIHLYLIFVR
jgi:hypothetical protein